MSPLGLGSGLASILLAATLCVHGLQSCGAVVAIRLARINKSWCLLYRDNKDWQPLHHSMPMPQCSAPVGALSL
jgi:hypothetical protein